LIVLSLVIQKSSCGQTHQQLTNKQTPLKTSTALCYATPVSNYVVSGTSYTCFIYLSLSYH